jgi:hypothetical protein
MINLFKTILLACCIGFSAMAKAIPISYDFTWTGDNNLSMIGMFTGEDANMDHILRARDLEISFLMFEGFDDGTSIGVTSPPLSFSTGFNFNFDLEAGTFLDGRSSGEEGNGQFWNPRGDGLGFLDGTGFAGFRLGGKTYLGCSTDTDPINCSTDNPQIYTATIKSVPEPSILALFAAGLFGIGFARRRKT